MKFFNILVVVFLIGLISTIKPQECIVIPDPEFPEIPHPSYGDPEILGDFSPTEVRHVYVAAHIVRSSSGTGGISSNDLETAITQLKAAYSDVMIDFIHDHTDYIDNDDYIYLTKNVFLSLAQINVIPGKLNIYFVPNGSINGIAYVPGNRCAVINSAAINGSTLAHEIGHNFYLYHTHSDAVDPPNDCTPVRPLELVNGSNCTTAGDFLCDTPAELFNCGSGILGYVYTNTCQYFGTFRDANNQLYNPDTHNFMGYAPANCRDSFTEQQIQKMNQTLTTILSYLINVPVPLANKVSGNIIPNETNKPSTLTVIGGPTVNSGTNANLLDGNSYDIRTNQERFSSYLSFGNIKHNNWNSIASQFKLTENFTVDRTISPYRDANFLSLNYSKIKVMLEGQQIPEKGSAFFLDPWYVLANGSQPGDHWINFTSEYEPTGKEGATEKGVFLDQLISSGTYYNIWAGDQQINLGSPIGVRQFYLQNWTSTGADLQAFSHNHQKVVFTSPNAVVQANLKGQGLSNNQNAYLNNSQRKFVRTNDGVMYNLYESLNRVWLEKSTDNGSTWSIINNGNPLKNADSRNPSMCLTYYNGLIIVFETEGLIWIYEYNPATNIAYERTSIYSCTISPYQSNPVVTYCFNDNASVTGPVVIWKSYGNDAFCGNAGLYYAMINADNWTASPETIITNTDINSYDPSIAGNDPIHSEATWKGDPMKFNLVWEQRGSVNSSIMFYHVERLANKL